MCAYQKKQVAELRYSLCISAEGSPATNLVLRARQGAEDVGVKDVTKSADDRTIPIAGRLGFRDSLVSGLPAAGIH